jgi:FtsH-binding integral membrane protein
MLSEVPWALILGAFLIVAWLASRMAYRLKTLPGQYAGLGLYVLAKGLILVPLLDHAERLAPGVVEQAAQMTVAGFAALTAIVLTTRRDFSFLRPFLYWAGLLALMMIFAALLHGLRLGTWFNLAMIGLAGAAILYDTSKLAERLRGGRAVAASLSLLASIGMMFWHLVRYATKLRRLR